MALESFLTILILLGAIQGFIVTGILFFSPAQNRFANRNLAVLIFLISLASLGVYLMLIGIKYTSPAWMIVSQVVPFFVVMPIGPLIYFYVLSFSTSPNFLPKNYRRHFVPVAFDLIPQILFILLYAGIIPLPIESLNAFVDQYDTYVDLPRWAFVTMYLIFSVVYLKSVDQKRPEEIKRLKWLRQFIKIFLGFQIIWFAHLIPYVIPSLQNELLDTVGWFPIYLPLAGLIYYFGIKGILVSNSLSTKNDSIINSRLSPDRVSFILARLKNAMEVEKLYLEPALTVSTVANHVEIPAKQISAVINQAEAKSFNEFVNAYRVEEFKKRIHDPKFQFMTIVGIALECGFNSQATFQRTFKAFERMSPTEYSNFLKNEKRISA
jgi:AraC-like DNA-binding protein